MPERRSPPTAKRLRILHVVAPGPFGGLESVVAMLATGATRRGHAVRVAAVLDLEPKPHPFEATLPGVEIVPLRLPPRAYLRERLLIADAIRELAPQLVHTHGYRADLQAGAVAHRLGVPTLSTVHGFTGGDWKNRVYERLQRRALRRADAVIAVSRPLLERLREEGISSERLHLVTNAWGGRTAALPRGEARRRLGLASDPFVVGWVGRLSFEKGADVLIEALARLRDPPIVACVVGEGPEQATLAERAVALGVGERVHWAGAVPDAGRLFAAFDVFALSSRTEGTPMALFEAMDAGVPVVATAVGGVPDVIRAEHARLVPPEDPEALARALAAVAGDRQEAARRAEQARSRLAAVFGPEPWLDAYEQIYRDVLRDSRGHRR